jgi:hypothetical protein
MLLIGLVTLGAGCREEEPADQGGPPGGPPPDGTNGVPRIDQASVDRILATWKERPREAAREVIRKHGLPGEATPVRLIWHNNGPWKYTEVVNEEIPHQFPMPHVDMVYQAINYRVPPEKAAELLQYDGSIIIERTKGELAARCDREVANFLAINLAHEIVTGMKNVGEARLFYAEAMREMKHPEYKVRFRFDVPTGNQGDPDQEVFPAPEMP